ncbi:MAG: hypothetical protein U0L43_04230, partial [Muribaculaceae bacterium]|nr:hypothetical protein [Muribaculaceae bacterium]
MGLTIIVPLRGTARSARPLSLSSASLPLTTIPSALLPLAHHPFPLAATFPSASLPLAHYPF